MRLIRVPIIIGRLLEIYNHFREFVIYGRKLLLILISVFLSSISSQAQAFAMFLVLLLAYRLHLKAQPFDTPELNDLEGKSLLCSMSITFIGMFFLSGKVGHFY